MGIVGASQRVVLFDACQYKAVAAVLCHDDRLRQGGITTNAEVSNESDIETRFNRDNASSGRSTTFSCNIGCVARHQAALGRTNGQFLTGCVISARCEPLNCCRVTLKGTASGEIRRAILRLPCPRKNGDLQAELKIYSGEPPKTNTPVEIELGQEVVSARVVALAEGECKLESAPLFEVHTVEI